MKRFNKILSAEVEPIKIVYTKEVSCVNYYDLENELSVFFEGSFSKKINLSFKLSGIDVNIYKDRRKTEFNLIINDNDPILCYSSIEILESIVSYFESK